MSRPPTPYDHAPQLPVPPEGAFTDVRSLVRGQFWELEVGPGRGGFLFERADVEPNCAILGLEVRRKWATIVDGKLAERGLGARARVFAEDALHMLPTLGPDGVLARAYLHFPDPWWKKKHTKRLVVGDRFASEIVRLLAPGGELFVQTDVTDRADEYELVLSATCGLSPAGDSPGSPRMAENPYGARSPREHRAIADGLPVYRLRWRRAAGESTSTSR